MVLGTVDKRISVLGNHLKQINTYTMADVRKHDDEHDCWIVIRNKVYDVTKFLEIHPGGFTSLLRVGGTDATDEFVALHQDNTIQNMVNKGVVYMGDLIH